MAAYIKIPNFLRIINKHYLISRAPISMEERLRREKRAIKAFRKIKKN